MRYKQNQPGKKPIDLSGYEFPTSARITASRGLKSRKETDMAAVLKKKSAKSKRRKKSYGRFKMGTQNHQWGKRGHGPDRSQNHVILAISQWRTQKESPTSDIFCHWRCGPISTRIGAYENQHLKLFDVGVTFFFWVVSGFLFSVRKQKTENFLKISNRTQNVTPTPERAEKNIQSYTWDFFRST